jgi:hypothetical protein
MMLVIWIFAVLIIPRTAVLVAGRSVEVPSVDQINYEKNKFQSQLWEEDRKKMDAYWQANPPTEGASREDAMRGFRTFMSDLSTEREEKTREFASRLNEDRRNREGVRQNVALNIARLSPASAFSLAATDLMGTSLELKHRYQESANAYQQSYRQFIQQKTGVTGGFFIVMGGEEEEEQDPIDPRELPVFEYEEPETDTFIDEALPDMGLLLVFNVLFFAGAFLAFLRYDVR